MNIATINQQRKLWSKYSIGETDKNQFPLIEIEVELSLYKIVKLNDLSMANC